MQLRLWLAGAGSLGALFGILFVTFAIVEPVRIVRDGDRKLTLAPLGFAYEGKPFTGAVFEKTPDGSLARLAFVWRGLQHGPDLQWYANGRRSVERHYRYGKEAGTHKSWYEDGNVRSLKTFENGQAHGEFYDWHPNGQLSQFVVYASGKEIAAKSWTAGGKPFYNYVWRDGRTIGLQGDSFCAPKKN